MILLFLLYAYSQSSFPVETSLSRTVSTISLYDVPAGSPRNQTD